MNEENTKISQIQEKIIQSHGRKIEEQEEVQECLSFLLGEEMYSFNTQCIKEIILISKIYPVPATPDYLTGIINLRGEILPVVDLKKILGLQDATLDENARIVIAEGRFKICFLADFIIDIVHIPVTDIQPPISTIEKTKVDYFDGEVLLGEDLLGILNLDKIIDSEYLKEPSKI
ncbi:chemotaxis protein CheW [Elusimicrobiota bacterium]